MTGMLGGCHDSDTTPFGIALGALREESFRSIKAAAELPGRFTPGFTWARHLVGGFCYGGGFFRCRFGTPAPAQSGNHLVFQPAVMINKPFGRLRRSV